MSATYGEMPMEKIKEGYITDDDGNYTFIRAVAAEEILGIASKIIEGRIARGESLNSPADTKRYLALELGLVPHEVFCCIFLDSRHRVISFDRMFNGTINGSSVYPREVVRAALRENAAAVVFAHNHPSGNPEPSQADRSITRQLVEACKLVDVRVIDHVVVGGAQTVSFAERGWL